MPQPTSMKALGSRTVGNVQHMEWNNKMDLIALGNEKGEVLIQRLNWQKIVTFPPPSEGVSVSSLSWQNDEPVVAVGYSNGKVVLVDAEREDIIFNLTYKDSVKKVHFSKIINVPDYKNTYRKQSKPSYEVYLPPLPNLSSGGSSLKRQVRKTFAKGSPCFLVVLLESGVVHLLLLGALKCGTLDFSLYVQNPDDFHVYDVQLSNNCNALYALVRDGYSLNVLHLNNCIFQELLSPMMQLALILVNLFETKSYIDDTIQCMTEAWETVLMEMDNKLTKYANQQPEGSISADFLELLVCGYATLEIEEFLMDELTEKGAKKLATSVELSCSTMQSLAMKPLQYAASNMFYFLNTVKGLSRISLFFEPLLSTESAELTLRACGSFLLKIQELQQVIDQCVSDIKLFFTWLGIVIIRLRQQDVPEEIAQLTPEDTIYLAEYLNSFEDSIIENDDGTATKRKFNLEKVGQYLDNRNLHQISKADPHHLWNKLLEENECLLDSGILYPHNKHTSLIQERDRLFNLINEMFQKPSDSITANFQLDATINCAKDAKQNEQFRRCSYFNSEKTQRDLFVTTINHQECVVLEFDKDFNEMKSIRIQLNPGPLTPILDINRALLNLSFVDIKFYNEGIVSMLLKNTEERSCHFMQFQLEIAKSKSTQHIMPQNINLIDLGTAFGVLDAIENISLKTLDGVCTQLAVSGSRKVASILSDGSMKMTIFEMEIEDDEDDTEMSQNSFLEASKESVE